MSKIEQHELRDAFSAFMTGVTVVTTNTSDNLPVGFTANSFTSVSLDPPLLLVCPGKSLGSFEVFNDCENFAVNILAEDQQHISNTFATSGEERFSNIEWSKDANQCPLLDGASVSFSCRTHQRIDAGDHIILIGEILQINNASLPGLGYCSDGYFSLGLERQAAEMVKPSSTTNIGAIIEFNEQVFLEQSANGLALPLLSTEAVAGSLGELKQQLELAGLDINFGPVYSIFKGQRNDESFIFYRAHATSAACYSQSNYYPTEQINTLDFSSEAIQAMLLRYVDERKQGVFNLYIGDEKSGDVHLIGETK